MDEKMRDRHHRLSEKRRHAHNAASMGPPLAGKTIKIGVDPESPPWVVRDKTTLRQFFLKH
jgi:hypothetical protein